MGLLWNKALTVTTGQANVIAHVDDVLALHRRRRARPDAARRAAT